MERPTGKYVVYREEYLKEEKPEYYRELIMSGKLNEHLHTINKQAKEMKEHIMERLKKESPEWSEMEQKEELEFFTKLRLLTQFEMIADEHIYKDIIYV